MSSVDDAITTAAAVPFAMAVAVIAIALLRLPAARHAAPAELAAGVSLGLEFFLAYGLLRLSALDDFAALGVVAAVVLLRKVINAGIGFALRALGLRRTSGLRA
jgi:uncharacterized membrane protein